MSHIFLLRHGQAAPPGIMAGSFDFALTPAGKKQMRAWGAALSPLPVGLCLSSPLRRAQESAQIIAAMLKTPPTAPLRLVPDLREISLGEWENRSKNEIKHLYPREWEQRGNNFAAFAPPGGESFGTLAARVIPAFEALYPAFMEHEYVLLVAHQAVNRVILHHLGGSGSLQSGLRDIPQDIAALNRLHLDHTGAFTCRVLSVNEQPAASTFSAHYGNLTHHNQ